MIREVSYSLTGISPLLMHRYGGEKPSADKPARGKKTQAWIDENRKAKWTEAAYFADGTFHIPPENIEAMLKSGAKRSRKGKDFDTAVSVVEDFIPLEINGKIQRGNLEDFFRPEFIDIRGVVIAKARVDACRPIFRQWGLLFTVRYDDKFVAQKDIEAAMEYNALGDFRPRFGRFRFELVA